jgi:IPT/TIG domain-containing protein
LASVSPANVYARTAEFKLEAAGDKFTPAMRIYVDGRELPTAYKNPQQVSATIPAAFISNPGTRNVVVRTADNSLFSNQVQINVAAPPTPNFTYIGIISPDNRIADTALVQDRSNKNVLSVLKGDVIGGRFRVTSISDKELVLTDTSLKIKHTLAMSEGDKSGSALSRPTPRVDSEDDEP